jgi:CRISPR-associated protein Cmr4
MAQQILVGGLLTLHAETTLHPGSGASLGVVDLPVQRERHTHFPTIPGSSLKGVLRDAARTRNDKKDDDPLVVQLFGGTPTAANGGAGEGRAVHEPEAGLLSVSDARLLAMPVRSLKAVFAWVTCPAVLERLARDARLVGLDLGLGAFQVAEGKALCADHGEEGPVMSGRIVLEEFDFEVLKDGAASGDAKRAAGKLADLLLPTGPEWEATRRRFKRSLCVISDDEFAHFARLGTEVVARIGLDAETKTVKGGALFYQELLPAESIFYAVVLAEKPRRSGGGSANEVLERFKAQVLPPVLQVGADETMGRGFCATRLATGGMS